MVLALTLAPGLAVAGEEWEPLDGPAIQAALSHRVLAFPEDVAQDFLEDGRTIRAGAWGQWRVEGNRYCEIWSPGKRAICAEVDRRGIDIRFREQGGFIRIGRYADL